MWTSYICSKPAVYAASLNSLNGVKMIQSICLVQLVKYYSETTSEFVFRLLASCS